MRIIDKLLSFLAPFSCLFCGTEGSFMCDCCINYQAAASPICFICRELLLEKNICRNNCSKEPINRLIYAGFYQDIYRELVLSLKASHSREAAKSMAAILSHNLEIEDSYILCHVPTIISRKRARGFDQSALLAQEISRQLNLRNINYLLKTSNKRQVGASKDQRLINIKNAFRVINRTLLKDAKILLIDDVMTTGSTLEEAARVLLKNGAKQVDAMVFAVAS